MLWQHVNMVPQRCIGCFLKVLGIVGALDPHTHKVNQANIQGEGKLEREGVRPQRQHDPTGGLGAGQATTLGMPHNLLFFLVGFRGCYQE